MLCTCKYISNIILGYKAKRSSSCDKAAQESGTQECPILIEESPKKKASSNEKSAFPAILRCKEKSNVRRSTSYRVTDPLSYSPPLKTETVVIPLEPSSTSDTSEDEDTESSEDALSIREYHNGDERIPVLEKPKKAYYAADILRILSSPHPRSMKCTRQPMRVQNNAAFMVDVTVIPLDDIFADGNGCYVNNGHNTHTYKRKKSGNWKRTTSSRKDPLERREFHLERHYRRLKKYPEFRQTVSYLRDQRGEIVDNVALVQYLFKGKEHEIKVYPHGNSKAAKPFTRTKPSTVKTLRQNLEKYQPNEALAKTCKEMGGLFSCTSEASLPRGQTQAYNLKRTNTNNTLVSSGKRSKDEMTALNWYAKTEGKTFVRMQVLTDEPLIVITTENQLDDSVRFCTSEIDFSYLSVDPTFNFKNFSVMPTSYRNLLLKSRQTGKNPVFIGPIFIHHTKQRATYKQFFDKLKSIRGKLGDVISYGTDGEKALSDALGEAFPLAIHLRCFRHFRGNFQSHLKNLGINETRSYYDEVFGKQDGSIYQGLLDANSEDEFDARLNSLRESWAKREQCEVEKCKVYQWIEERSPMIKSSMIASVRTKAGLGNLPMKFYTNDSENTNRRLCDKTKGREQGETSFIREMKELIEDSQETEVVLAMYGASEAYEVREPFRKFELQREEWFRMNESQRRSYIKDVYSKSMEELYASENNASVYAENSDRHRVRDGDAQELPVEKSVLLKFFDHYFLQCVWKKAQRLLSEPQSILKAPSKDSKIKAFSVLSESTNVPNYVQIHGNAKVTCTCKQFPPKRICSHSVAVAEKEDMLKHFIDWLLKTNSSSNITLTATMNLNTSRSGRKGGISKRKRCATQSVTAVIDPFSGEVTSATQHTTQPVTTLPSTNPLQQAFPVATQCLHQIHKTRELNGTVCNCRTNIAELNRLTFFKGTLSRKTTNHSIQFGSHI